MIITIIDCDTYIGIYNERELIYAGSRYISAFEVLKLVEHHKVEIFGKFEVCWGWYDSVWCLLPKDLHEVHLDFEGESLTFQEYLEKSKQ